MADAKKKSNRVKVTTDKGIAVYPRVNKPDTKFDAAGVYSTKIRLSGDSAQKVIDVLDAMAEQSYTDTIATLTEACEGLAGAKLKQAQAALEKVTRADKSYKAVLDDESGDETGEFDFNFKMKATYKDRKTEVVKTQRPKLTDSKGNEIDPEQVAVWGGSTIRVGGYASPFYTAKAGAGASLRLSTVCVIKLVSGGDNAFDFGDEEEDEDAFVAPAPKPKSASASAPADAATGGDATDETDDF